jgi:hypothetical protein
MLDLAIVFDQRPKSPQTFKQWLLSGYLFRSMVKYETNIHTAQCIPCAHEVEETLFFQDSYLIEVQKFRPCRAN